MSQLKVDGAMFLDGKRRTITAEDGIITEVTPEGTSTVEADVVIDGRGLLAMPGLCNAHTHAPMSLLRGLGEDLELKDWLERCIWPVEARMKDEHLRAGMALACLEMIRTGTTFFNDMYFSEGQTAEEVRTMGLRAVLGEGFIDLFDEERREAAMKRTLDALKGIEMLKDDRIRGALAPHAPYTVSREGFEWCMSEAEERGLTVHVHLSETETEVKASFREHGCSPVRVLDGYGALADRTVAAHCVHLSDEDAELLGGRGVRAVHLPASNMKLSVGGQMRLPLLRHRGVPVVLGTDGAASNNSLDMFQSMKLASLLCKHGNGAASIKAMDVIDMATSTGYQALGINGGRLEEGCVADIILLDLDHVSMVPGNDPSSDIVHSASGACVRYTIVGGRVLMENGRVKGEGKIIRTARRMAEDLRGGQRSEEAEE